MTVQFHFLLWVFMAAWIKASGYLSSMCLKCICKVESGCRPLDCMRKGNSVACGYFQINFDYYLDCGRPEPFSTNCTRSTKKDCWIKCYKDYDCVERCVRDYMRKYGNSNGAGSDCESYARLHDGGPNGANRQRSTPPNYESTTPYWERVQTCLRYPHSREPRGKKSDLSLITQK